MKPRRTTIVLSLGDQQALKRASKAGIRTVTAAYRRRGRPLVGWLKLTAAERAEIRAEVFRPR